MGASTVAIVGAGSSGEAIADELPCDGGAGVTLPHLPDNYSVHAELRDASDRVLATTADAQVYLSPFGPQVDLGVLAFSP